MTFADYCRWANMGYRGGHGSEEDIKQRVELLEACCASYSKALRNLHSKIDSLTKKE